MNQFVRPPQHVSPLGHHLIADFFDATNLVDAAAAEAILTQAAEAAGAVVLAVNTHDFGDRTGFTGVALLAESHISIHTWPENAYVAIDVFMCGAADPQKSLSVLNAYFQPGNTEVHQIQRGQVGQFDATAALR